MWADISPSRSPSPSPLHADRPIWPEYPGDPAIVVGLPRSGSTFLTHVLCQLPDWWFFNDLYFYQQARAIGAMCGPLDGSQFEQLLFIFGRQLRAYIRRNEFYAPRMTLGEVDGFVAAMRKTYAGGARTVEATELLREACTRLAVHHGARRWGYKTPQDFMHLPELRKIFPALKVIYLVRDPRAVLASYKFNRSHDGTPGQYHPIVHALYWRMASQTLDRVAPQFGAASLMEVRFEDVIANAAGQAKRFAAFLETPVAIAADPASSHPPPNTTFRAGRRETITPTETWICERIAGRAMKRRGYGLTGARPRERDVPDLMNTTARFARHHAASLVSDVRRRESAKTFLRRLLPLSRGSAATAS